MPQKIHNVTRHSFHQLAPWCSGLGWGLCCQWSQVWFAQQTSFSLFLKQKISPSPYIFLKKPNKSKTYKVENLATQFWFAGKFVVGGVTVTQEKRCSRDSLCSWSSRATPGTSASMYMIQSALLSRTSEECYIIIAQFLTDSSKF